MATPLFITILFNFPLVAFASLFAGFTATNNCLTEVFDDEDNVECQVIDLKGTLKRSFAAEAMMLNMHGNVICSPLSALLPLGKLILGAEPGKSRDEMLKATGTTIFEIKEQFKDLFHKLKYLPGVTLTVASRLYLSKDVEILPQYEEDAMAVFYSSLEKLDFDNPTAAARSVNSWVNSQTNGKIQDIVSSADVKKDTKLLLVNAIYFSGRWTEPFKEVFVGEFHSPFKMRKISMMKKKQNLNYVRSQILDAQIVELPYEGNNASFIIVLPNSKNGLPILLSELKLAPELLNNEMKKMEPTEIILTIPKFKIETELDLKTLYQKIGVHTVFTKRAGLTRISKYPLTLSKAVQKAYIEVNEKGSEAAAASAIIGYMMAQMTLPPTVLADHPFMYFVVAEKQQLFAGIFNDE